MNNKGFAFTESLLKGQKQAAIDSAETRRRAEQETQEKRTQQLRNEADTLSRRLQTSKEELSAPNIHIRDTFDLEKRHNTRIQKVQAAQKKTLREEVFTKSLLWLGNPAISILLILASAALGLVWLVNTAGTDFFSEDACITLCVTILATITIDAAGYFSLTALFSGFRHIYRRTPAKFVDLTARMLIASSGLFFASFVLLLFSRLTQAF